VRAGTRTASFELSSSCRSPDNTAQGISIQQITLIVFLPQPLSLVGTMGVGIGW
jgi:hypothetical protein